MIRVLLVDDHAIIRDGIKQILADTGDLVVAGEAASGTEALNLVAEQDWDLVILDISMPGKSGLEVLKLIRQKKPGLPILIFTMHPEQQYALRALHAGANGYLTKESDGEVLIAAIRRVLAGRIYFTENVAELLVRERMPKAHKLSHSNLSDREFQVFEKLVSGVRLTDIASELNLSIKTISTHKSRIMQKMKMSSDAELVRYAVARGLVTIPEE
ncbi:MAG: response regulator transcription factor [Sulfuritalea sp.]|jgi:DNA-binding NarL/FixJ family response regulator|nr:response regulator transcription factor [Sulfuritalea sp.]